MRQVKAAARELPVLLSSPTEENRYAHTRFLCSSLSSPTEENSSVTPTHGCVLSTLASNSVAVVDPPSPNVGSSLERCKPRDAQSWL